MDMKDVIEGAVHHVWRGLGKTGKPQPHEHTVMAGFVLTNIHSTAGSTNAEPAHPAAWVVSLGTGTKCLGASKRSVEGEALHDSHAEVIARRALMAWVYSELSLAMHVQLTQLVLQQPACPIQPDQEGPSHTGSAIPGTASSAPGETPALSTNGAKQSAFVYDNAIGRFALRAGLQLHMYVSQAPCGDASIIAVPEDASAKACEDSAPACCPSARHAATSSDALTGRAYRNGLPQGSTAADASASASMSSHGSGSFRVRTGAKAIRLMAQGREDEGTAPLVMVPQAHDVDISEQAGEGGLGLLRRKPGRGDATLSMSCSDKLARWSFLGLQGALLAGLLHAPLYCSSICVAITPDVQAAGEAAQMAAHAALVRALGDRLQPLAPRLAHHTGSTFRLHAPRLHVCSPAAEDMALRPTTKRTCSSGASINWSAAAGSAMAHFHAARAWALQQAASTATAAQSISPHGCIGNGCAFGLADGIAAAAASTAASVTSQPLQAHMHALKDTMGPISSEAAAADQPAAVCVSHAVTTRARPPKPQSPHQDGCMLEVTNSSDGRKAGAAKSSAARASAKTRSRLCRAALLDSCLQLCKLMGKDAELAQLPYRSLKEQHAADYMQAWATLRHAPSLFERWISKPLAEGQVKLHMPAS